MSDVIAHIAFRSLQAFIFGTSTLLDAIGRSAFIESRTAEEYWRELSGDGVQPHARGAGTFSVTGPEDAVRAFVQCYIAAIRAESDLLEVNAVVVKAEAEVPLELRRASARGTSGLRRSVPYGVAVCPNTGLPVAIVRGDADSVEVFVRNSGGHAERRVSPEVSRQREMGRAAHDAFVKACKDVLDHPTVRLTLPTEMDAVAPDLGTSTSVAMIVADVNEFGSKLQGLDDSGRREVGEELRSIMRTIAVGAIGIVAGAVDRDGDRVLVTGRPDDLAIPLALCIQKQEHCWQLPIRPLIGGGDDLAFVVEGRLAWSVARQIMRGFEAAVEQSETLVDVGLGNLRIAVGMAIVPAGLSLLRAHDVAEQCLARAKQDRQVSAVAWQVGEHTEGSLLGPVQSEVYRHNVNLDKAGDGTTVQELAECIDPKIDGSLRAVLRADGAQGGWAMRRAAVHDLRGRIAAATRSSNPAYRDLDSHLLDSIAKSVANDDAQLAEEVRKRWWFVRDAIQCAADDLMIDAPAMAAAEPEPAAAEGQEGVCVD